MNILKKEDGKFSALMVFNLFVTLAGLAGVLFPIWQPFIPDEFLPFVVAGIASLNMVIRYLSTSSVPIQGSIEVKESLGVK